MIAALYVETDGAYFGVPGVDPWDEPRDARKYAGPHPVVAHPPCQRWGRFWHGSTRKPLLITIARSAVKVPMFGKTKDELLRLADELGMDLS